MVDNNFWYRAEQRLALSRLYEFHLEVVLDIKSDDDIRKIPTRKIFWLDMEDDYI